MDTEMDLTVDLTLPEALEDLVRQGLALREEERAKEEAEQRRAENEKARKDALYREMVLERLPEELRPYVTNELRWDYDGEVRLADHWGGEELVIEVPGLAEIRARVHTRFPVMYYLPGISGGLPQYSFLYANGTSDLLLTLGRARELYLEMQVATAAYRAWVEKEEAYEPLTPDLVYVDDEDPQASAENVALDVMNRLIDNRLAHHNLI